MAIDNRWQLHRKSKLICAVFRVVVCCECSFQVLLNSCFIHFFPCKLFQDIKKYKFHYYFAYPSLSQTVATIAQPATKTNIKHHFTDNQLKEITRLYQGIASQMDKSFFILEKNVDTFSVKRLTDCINHNAKENNFQNVDLNAIYFCCSDMTAFETGGWPVRLFLVALVHLWYVFGSIQFDPNV